MCNFILEHFAGQFQFLSKSDNSNRRFTCVCERKSTGINQIFVRTGRSETKFPDINDMYILLPAFSFATTCCLKDKTNVSERAELFKDFMLRRIFECLNVWRPLVLTRCHPRGYFIILEYDGQVSESCQHWRMFNLMVWRWCVFVFWLVCPSVANYVGLTCTRAISFLASSANRKVIAAN